MFIVRYLIRQCFIKPLVGVRIALLSFDEDLLGTGHMIVVDLVRASITFEYLLAFENFVFHSLREHASSDHFDRVVIF